MTPLMHLGKWAVTPTIEKGEQSPKDSNKCPVWGNAGIGGSGIITAGHRSRRRFTPQPLGADSLGSKAETVKSISQHPRGSGRSMQGFCRFQFHRRGLTPTEIGSALLLTKEVSSNRTILTTSFMRSMPIKTKASMSRVGSVTQLLPRRERHPPINDRQIVGRHFMDGVQRKAFFFSQFAHILQPANAPFAIPRAQAFVKGQIAGCGWVPLAKVRSVKD